MLPMIEVKAYGLEEALAMVESARRILDEAGNTAKGVALFEKVRADTADDSNAEIVDRLIEAGRDFFNLAVDDAQPIADVFTSEVEKRLAANDKSKKPLTPQSARGVAAGAYIKAMQEYMRRVVDRIKSGRTVEGGTPAELSEVYSKFKQGQYGFTSPIGVASGQLLANLDPSNVANIRPLKG